jgi:hypothetical protein
MQDVELLATYANFSTQWNKTDIMKSCVRIFSHFGHECIRLDYMKTFYL